MNMARGVSKVFRTLVEVLNWVGYVSLCGIVLITSVDVIGRYFFNRPLLGSLEILELSMAVLGGFAILYTTTRRGHISVDLFYVNFSKGLQMAVDVFGSLLGFATWAVIAYQVFRLGKRSFDGADATTLLHIPIAPFQFILALGIAVYSLVLLVEGIRPLVSSKESEKKEELSI
jgi:TRAP-type transport system small permease protein